MVIHLCAFATIFLLSQCCLQKVEHRSPTWSFLWFYTQKPPEDLPTGLLQILFQREMSLALLIFVAFCPPHWLCWHVYFTNPFPPLSLCLCHTCTFSNKQESRDIHTDTVYILLLKRPAKGLIQHDLSGPPGRGKIYQARIWRTFRFRLFNACSKEYFLSKQKTWISFKLLINLHLFNSLLIICAECFFSFLLKSLYCPPQPATQKLFRIEGMVLLPRNHISLQ